jgi:5-oxoprolinase (ATP-hydrolysing)
VVGGNVLTSQRVVDVIFKAFEAVAGSQGCMNNLTFGNATLGYYETIAGGSGAGPGWNGRSGVHSHMTNTRITDPEILERRYPVILQQFSLRRGSGGVGRWSGGAGVIREIEFRCPMTVGILSERRATQPYGLDGGSPGSRGVNLLVKVGGRLVNMGGKASVDVCPWDRIRILTPGGGGYGSPLTASHSHPHSRSRMSAATADDIPQDALESNAVTLSFPRAVGSVHAYKATQETC